MRFIRVESFLRVDVGIAFDVKLAVTSVILARPAKPVRLVLELYDGSWLRGLGGVAFSGRIPFCCVMGRLWILLTWARCALRRGGASVGRLSSVLRAHGTGALGGAESRFPRRNRILSGVRFVEGLKPFQW